MSNKWLRVVYSDMLTASETFKTQGRDFRAITANSFSAFGGACDDHLYDAMQTFLQTLDAAQEAIAEGIIAHGVKLKLAHDTYDQGETATKMSAQGLLQALRNPDVIQ